MSDSFKSSTLGPEALAARIEHERKLKDQRERDRALRKRDEARREQALAFAAEDSKNYDTPEPGTEVAPPQIPMLSRGLSSIPAADQRFTITSNSTANTPKGGFKLKRF